MRTIHEVLEVIRADLERELGRPLLEKELANRLGVSARRLSDWKIRGTLPLPELWAYAHARGWTLDHLLGDEDSVREATEVYGLPLSDDERQLLDTYRGMEQTDQKYFRRLMGLISKKKEV